MMIRRDKSADFVFDLGNFMFPRYQYEYQKSVLTLTKTFGFGSYKIIKFCQLLLFPDAQESRRRTQ